ncbi:MAG TPA: hypothetical protein VGV92_03720 [Gammaproteobacteria bacterium]|nr:hypothetical protein [Gammaproteobacteria bacterium]
MANENIGIDVPLDDMNNAANNGNAGEAEALLAPHPVVINNHPQQQARSCSSSFWPPSRATTGTLSLAGFTAGFVGFMWTFTASATNYPTLANLVQMPAMIVMLGSAVRFGMSFCNTDDQNNHAAQP